LTDLLKGLVIQNHLKKYIIEYNEEIYSCEVSGRFKYMAFLKSDYPVVGDYVHFRMMNEEEGIIEKVEERRNTLSRLSTSLEFNEQIFAANIDVLFICISMNEDFHMKKVLNFMNLSKSAFETIVLLTKSDLTDHPQDYINEVKKYVENQIYGISVYHDEDVCFIKNLLKDKVAIFIGSSGVGKSTLINALLKEEHFQTKTIRQSDAQGRHTTVHKELVHLDNGGIVIDSPGIRVVENFYHENLEDEFSDIVEFSSKCKFRDCNHEQEPGCYVKEMLETGELLEERFDQYLRAKRLNAHVKRQMEIKERMLNKRKNSF
jgi:ribosome biogenesis GTPase